MHQPSYSGGQNGMLKMPWVRHHTSHAYFDMLLAMKDKRDIRMTFNYSPILLSQVRKSSEALANGESPDINHQLSLKSPDKLTGEELERIRTTFFFGGFDTMIAPYPRYKELLEKAQRNEDFNQQEILDLQVLANLVWIGPTMREANPFVQDLVAQGRDYEPFQKTRVLDLQAEALTHLIPSLKEMQDNGQIEISVSPYYHPILPMLINSDVADRAEFRPLPPFTSRPDARAQVSKGIELFEELFGRKPQGIWPSEGAVSEEAAKLIFSSGFKWLLTCDGVLGKTLERDPHITERYHPWRYKGGMAFFRDSKISNAISFKYGKWDSAFGAAQEVLISLLGLKDVWEWKLPPLVTIMLDGENPWEHYRNKTFVWELISALAHHQEQGSLYTTTPSQYLEENSGAEFNYLDKLSPGTWAQGASFSTWLGNDLTKRMWETLRAARAAFEEFSCCGDHGEAFEAKCRQIHEILLAAEGSDTFWWAGPHHDTPQLEEFDAIFREKIRKAYELMGKVAPENLSIPMLNVKKREIDLGARLQEEPIITIDPSSTELSLPVVGGQMRPMVVDTESELVSFIQSQRDPGGEKIVYKEKEQDTPPITERPDPLGRDVTTTISLLRSLRPQPTVRMETLVQGEKGCIFCDPEEVAGPLVVTDHAFSGRNLFGFLDDHEVLIIQDHIEHMKEIKLRHVSLMQEILFNRISNTMSQGKYNRIIAGWNFGGRHKPWDAGASIEHMHMQLGYMVNPLLIHPDAVASTVEAYRKELGIDFFEYYLYGLRRAGLTIWEDENVVLYAPFAPRMKDELGIFAKGPEIANYISVVSRHDLRQSINNAIFLAIRGLSELKVPRNPRDKESELTPANIQSFNLLTWQKDLNDKRRGYRLRFELMPRQNTWAFAELFNIYVVDRYPEDTANLMRRALKESHNVDVQEILENTPL